jgi:hypothetical protein
MIFEHYLKKNKKDDDEHEWITKTCRKGYDQNVEYKENYKVFSRCYNLQQPN